LDEDYYTEIAEKLACGELDMVKPITSPYPDAPKDMTYVYALAEYKKRWWNARYIGITKKPNERMIQHLSHSEGEKKIWIEGLIATGKYPAMFILDIISDKEIREKERAFVWHFRHMERCKLLNETLSGMM
jgi:hypothetical protein